jgi:decaprenylphospho-beta-D-ribofuranose 2-oxidase
MSRYLKHELASWGNFPREEVYDFRPDSPAEIAPILKEHLVPTYISRGLGRSYGDAALNAGAGVIRQERLNRFLAWDEENLTLESEAGVTLQEILDVFLPRGYFLPVTPGTKFITIGGAVAADVHGKNHHRDGSLAEFLDHFTLLTGTGAVLTCSRTENTDVFWATLGGMGLTGVILTVRLKLKPVETAFLTVDYKKAANLDGALEAFQQDHAYRYSVAWIDCLASGAALGRSVLMRGDHTPLAQLPEKFRGDPLRPRGKRTKSVPFRFPGFALNSWSVRLFNNMYYRRHRDGTVQVDYDNFFYPLDSILNWNRVYGKRGFVQYQVAIPSETSRPALVELLEKLSRSRQASFLAVLKTFGPANAGLLSFPIQGATLALDLPNIGQPLLTLLDALDAIVLKHGGRVYLAKDARLSRPAFEAMYPRVDEFRQLKHRLDPEGLFSSSLARRLGLAE